MRKVTQETVNAFLKGEKKTIGNTSTDGKSLCLHGNCIARKVDGKIYISNAGWQSVTTKERLNGLLYMLGKAGIFQKDFQWFRMAESENPWKDAQPFPFHEFIEA